MRKFVPITALALMFLTALLGFAASAQARTDNTTKPVLLIHGYDTLEPTDGLVTAPCGIQWALAEQTLALQGFSNIKTVAYEPSDMSTGCDIDLVAKANAIGYPIDTSSTFVEIARALNAYIYDTYTSNGKAVDLVGHSMGGLIARAAVLGGVTGLPGFRPIDVEDAYTLGTPHLGAPLAVFCPIIGPKCAAMAPSSPQISWLNTNGNPQGARGTDWTVGRALVDELVPPWSAWGMSVNWAHKVQHGTIEHVALIFDPITLSRVGVGLKLGTK